VEDEELEPLSNADADAAIKRSMGREDAEHRSR
jgi:hypothetical protein